MISQKKEEEVWKYTSSYKGRTERETFTLEELKRYRGLFWKYLRCQCKYLENKKSAYNLPSMYYSHSMSRFKGIFSYDKSTCC